MFRGVCQSIVVHPASDVGFQSSFDFIPRPSLVTSGQLSNSAFHPFQALAGYPYSHPACSSIVEAKAQKLPLHCSSDCAFLLILFQAHSFFYEATGALHHSLCCPFAFDIDIAVIRIAHKAVPPFLPASRPTRSVRCLTVVAKADSLAGLLLRF